MRRAAMTYSSRPIATVRRETTAMIYAPLTRVSSIGYDERMMKDAPEKNGTGGMNTHPGH